MNEEVKPKRKTTTSSAVKARYNKKTYCMIAAYLPKELAADFKAKCAEKGIPQSQIIKQAVEKFLEEN